jgi:LPS-assembly lipoprotein
MRSVSRRSAICIAFVCAAMPMLVAGCGDSGFHPLYATSPLFGGTETAAKLASLEIAPIPGRVGQRLRNEMIFQTTGGGAEALNPAYRLEIAVTESISATLVQTDGNSSGSVYNLNAKFRLIRVADKTVALQGESNGRIMFQRFESVYSNVRARKEAEDRAATTIAEDLKSRLAAFLSNAA